ncbi:MULTISPECIES: hypothetical protein [Rahnella]|uniref:DUF4239 domain-containing protein n=1 Tax=Rahnella laticis TaxID=2787622 RepID=A0ABS0E0R0_9GAMM|nr:MULTISPECIES: hypothetical protein [Rahnella]MBF7978683.1 hypothetical protein [Rahnella laticis]MBF7998773.1 hypothetical protein [Rahnella sp. LAC-M12]
MDALSNIPSIFIEKYYATAFIAYTCLAIMFLATMVKLGITPKNFLEFKDYMSRRRIDALRKYLSDSTCDNEKIIIDREIDRLRKYQLTGISSEMIQEATTLILLKNKLPMNFFKLANSYISVNENGRITAKLSTIDKIFRWFFRIIGLVSLLFGIYIIAFPLILSMPPIKIVPLMISGLLITFYGIFFSQLIPSEKVISKINNEINSYYDNSTPTKKYE